MTPNPAPIFISTAFILAFFGFITLALSQERPIATVFGAAALSNRRKWFQRVFGFALIVSSLPACIAATGASLGSILWVLIIISSAMMVVQILAWRPQWFRPARWLFK